MCLPLVDDIFYCILNKYFIFRVLPSQNRFCTGGLIFDFDGVSGKHACYNTFEKISISHKNCFYERDRASGAANRGC